jgi:hypothetical protein
MGFFSWNTQDTHKSIANSYSTRPTFTVYMFDDKGNKWREDKYEGYGVFGGKDYYELLAEMNGLESDRQLGIDLAFKDSPRGENPECKFPNLAEDPNWVWRSGPVESCPAQGYFYSDDEEDEYDQDEDM